MQTEHTGDMRKLILQGDSGFAVFRQGQLAFQTSPLQHFFDCPYQLASCPDFTQDTDRAEDASLHQLQLEAADIIVVATDGLWDNLHTTELLSLLPKSAQDVQQVGLLTCYVDRSPSNTTKGLTNL